MAGCSPGKTSPLNTTSPGRSRNPWCGHDGSFGRRASEGGTGTGGTVAGDQPDSDIEGEICPEPPENDRELIAPSGQEEDMHRTPQPPCQGTGQLQPAEIGHRALSTDGG